MTAQPRRRTARTALGAGALVAAVGLTVGGVWTGHADAAPESQSSGTVYANRPIADADLVPGAAAGEQFSFWTQGADERTHLTTAALLTPKGSAPQNGWPVVVYAHDPDGLTRECAPSQRRAARDSDTVTELLRHRYAVVVPDYTTVGVDGSPQYTDFTAAAAGMVDAMSAAADVESDLSDEWAVVGDGLGAGAAVALAGPDVKTRRANLDFRGAAATSLPIGYAETLAGLGPHAADVPTGEVVDVVYALAALGDEAEPLLTPRGAALVSDAATKCAPDLAEAVGSANISDLVRRSVGGTLAARLRNGLELPESGFTERVMLSQKLTDPHTLPAAAQYLAAARMSSPRVTVQTYLTGNADDAERAAVAAFVKSLF